MKCKHCYKGYPDCPYYKNDKCTYKVMNIVDQCEAIDKLFKLEKESKK